MIEYATADNVGCMLTTHDDKSRAILWRTVNQSENRSNSASKTRLSPEGAAFYIMCDAQSRHYERAMFQLISEGEKITTRRMASRIQKIERAETRVTGKPKEYSDAESYVGTVVTRDVLESEGYLADYDTRHYNYTQLTGKKGRVDNVKRPNAIPPMRVVRLDRAMMNQKDDTIIQHAVTCTIYGMADVYAKTMRERMANFEIQRLEDLRRDMLKVACYLYIMQH